MSEQAVDAEVKGLRAEELAIREDLTRAVQDFVSSYERARQAFGPVAHGLRVRDQRVKPLIGQMWERAVHLQQAHDRHVRQGKTGPGFPGKV